MFMVVYVGDCKIEGTIVNHDLVLSLELNIIVMLMEISFFFLSVVFLWLASKAE